MPFFDDSLLDNQAALAAADGMLRRLAQAGARIRIEAEQAADALSGVVELPRPRAVIAAGSEARLIRAMLEPSCPVPFLAWPRHGLPGWVGALDLVVVLATDGADANLVATAREAVRRGSQLIIACPQPSVIAEHVSGRDAILLPTKTGDTLAAAVIVLSALHRMQLGPVVDAEAVAAAFDRVAEDCSPYVDVAENPAKDLALGLAEAQPLVWGGSVLASRASRRVAETLRAASGRAALAADAGELVPVLASITRKDFFDDPFEDPQPSERRPALVILDDGTGDQLTTSWQNRLREVAEAADIRVCPLYCTSGGDLDRYAGLLQTGLFGAVYLAVGLGRSIWQD
ncbi:MAG TPA: SIS domain-containing protein [Microlunatus sp.]